MSLSSWYAILLYSFPKHYRRSRGEEMLGTLLDGAKPGQSRPSIRDAVGIIGAGLRCRVRIRRGPATLLAAVAATLTGSMLTAVLFAWAAWTITAPPLPSQAQADAIARSVVPQEPVWQSRHDFVFGDNGYDFGAHGRVEYYYGDVTLGSHALPTLPGMRILLSHNTLTITRATPPAVPWLTVFGAIIGAYAGWMLAARTSRLVARRHPAVLAATMTLASLTFLALAPMCFYAGVQFILGVDYGAPWIALYWSPLRTLTFIGLLSAALTLAIAESGQENAWRRPDCSDLPRGWTTTS